MVILKILLAVFILVIIGIIEAIFLFSCVNDTKTLKKKLGIKNKEED